MQKVRFIHTADLHLDTPFKGLGHLPEAIFERIKQSTFDSFERIITEAIRQKVDFVVISGDLYDGANRSLRAQLFLKKQFIRLEEASIEVFAIHGNHDHLQGKFVQLTWPENVHFFGSEEPDMHSFHKNNDVVAHLYGYSYPQRAVTENIAARYEVIDGAPFHIALLHGTVGGNTDHDPYAPFTIQELIEKPFDYWALGHIHIRSELNQEPPIVYPGNIQGLNRKEEGSKGCYLVELSEAGNHLQFIQTAPIQWQTTTLSAEGIGGMDDLLNGLQKLKETFRSNLTGTILSVSIAPDHPFESEFQDPSVIEEMLDHLQEGEEDEASFVWINRLVVEHRNEDLLRELKDSHFLKEMMEVFDGLDQLDEVLQPLSKHRKAKRFVSREAFDAEEIKREAQNLLIETMTRESGR
ncbi:metallophosphoesterase family protein [Pseudalkalibacillus sp. Hm43]|uniref:metallophosphoesterase family protein n=1 Tax=Pseudalkalibacillus sp. Hm43 TaxID=3450742 RepID=UPI003F432EEE